MFHSVEKNKTSPSVGFRFVQQATRRAHEASDTSELNLPTTYI